jgi:hypothetical protein
MALVRVFSPQSESEVLVAASLLEAHGIPAFIHNRGIGSILPGVQINAYNTQSIMVAQEHVTDAVELVAHLKEQPRAAVNPVRFRDKVRVLLEGFLCGWFVPGSRSGPTGIRESDDA